MTGKLSAIFYIKTKDNPDDAHSGTIMIPDFCLGYEIRNVYSLALK